MIAEQYDVLIVGAGPTGLALAMQLAKNNIDFCIIDKSSGPVEHSQAIGVQAGTLNALSKTIGQALVDDMISEGIPVQEMRLQIDNQKPILIDLAHNIPSTYNYLLSLEQNKTESIFRDYLNKKNIFVRQNVELTHLTQDKNGVVC